MTESWFKHLKLKHQSTDLKLSTSELHVNESVCCLCAYSVREKSLLVPPIEMNEKGACIKKEKNVIFDFYHYEAVDE